MNLENLKTGMILEFEDKEYATVLLNTRDGDIFSGKKHWGFIENLNFQENAVKVWQPSNNMSYSLERDKIVSSDRISKRYNWDLVWERPVTKQMTLEEIEEELGYKIEIVD